MMRSNILKRCISMKSVCGLCSKVSSEHPPLKQTNEKAIIVEKLGEITTIGFNRPEKRNCIDPETSVMLTEALENFEKDDTSCVGIIHGIGGNFCAGGDLKTISNIRDLESHCRQGNSYLGVPLRLIKKPLVAAVSGYAVAGGFEISLMCDLRVVEENAIMGLYNRRFGIPSMNGGSVRLAAMVGLSRALDLMLTGRSLTAQEALHWGLANRLVACGTALGQAVQVAGSLIKFPQKCLLEDRRILYKSAFNDSLESLLEYEKSNAFNVFNQESMDGAAKFIESGIGRHGKSYDLKERQIPEWEKD